MVYIFFSKPSLFIRRLVFNDIQTVFSVLLFKALFGKVPLLSKVLQRPSSSDLVNLCSDASRCSYYHCNILFSSAYICETELITVGQFCNSSSCLKRMLLMKKTHKLSLFSKDHKEFRRIICYIPFRIKQRNIFLYL